MKKPAKKVAALGKPTTVKKTIAKTTKATATKTTKAVPKKRNVISDGDSDGGMGSTPPEAKKQKKAPATKKAAFKAKPLQSKENESEVDDLGEGSGAPKGEEKKHSGDAYQKVCTRSNLMFVVAIDILTQPIVAYSIGAYPQTS